MEYLPHIAAGASGFIIGAVAMLIWIVYLARPAPLYEDEGGFPGDMIDLRGEIQP